MRQGHFHSVIRSLVILSLAGAAVLVSCGKKDPEGQTGNAGKKWKLTIVKYEDLQQTEDAERGLLAGLRDEGLVEGKDFDLYSRSAQGDLPAVRSLIDQVNKENTDLLISLQTPTLHTAIKRLNNIPIVFMVVANPFVISTVGENDSIHLSNVTGVYTMTTFERMIGYIKQVMPNVKKIGTLFSTSELNATYYKSQLIAAASNAGLQVESFGVSSRADISLAAQALCGKGIDAVCQIEDNLTSSAFPVIAQTAKKYKLPVFSFVNAQIHTGSSMVFAPDYYGASRETAKAVSQILRGKSPREIPFKRINKFFLYVNLPEAEGMKLKIPDALISQADSVFRSPGKP
jgi:putative tryptophan/tyrosine transport system substrate-binding protein